MTLPSIVSIWYQTEDSASIWNTFLYFLSISALPFFFLIPCLPFLVLPYYIFLERSCCLPVRFHYRFTCCTGLHSSRIARGSFPEDVYPWRPSTILDDEKTPNRQFLKQPSSLKERRGSRRCKITQLMRIRPSTRTKTTLKTCAARSAFPLRCFFPVQ